MKAPSLRLGLRCLGLFSVTCSWKQKERVPTKPLGYVFRGTMHWSEIFAAQAKMPEGDRLSNVYGWGEFDPDPHALYRTKLNTKTNVNNIHTRTILDGIFYSPKSNKKEYQEVLSELKKGT